MGLLAAPIGLGGAILTLIAAAFLLHNARIVDAKRPHASTTWMIVSLFVPLANLFVFPRELWRAWRGVAEAAGRKASGTLLLAWWVVNTVGAFLTHIILRCIIRCNLLPHWFDFFNTLLDVPFYILCILLFSRMRRSLAGDGNE